jgi:aminoglycoside phosphotransferase family enzyme/predicted kinase
LKPDLAQLIQLLLQATVYPDPTNGVMLRQTQMSCVFMTDDYVYKIKKPVNLGYVDYTSLEKRWYYCEREVELNRRLCPKGYIGVVAIRSDGDKLTIDGPGETIEYAVKMRRFPAEFMLENLLLQNSVTSEMMLNIALKVADFHRLAETNSAIAHFGLIEAIKINTEENFNQTEKYFGRSISEKQFVNIRDYTRSFILNNKNLLEQRVNQGKIRDCHGDLHAAHICFCHDLCIYDCIEFNDRFRYGDIASEVAFLAMDLDHYGRADLSRYFVQEYIKQSQDPELSSLMSFYKCYRAYIRGKVASFKLDDPYVTEDDRKTSQQTAEGYFDLASSYARSKPALFITVGLTGCGKSTMAQALSQRLGLVHISSDITRKRLAGIPETEHRFDEPATGIYSAEFTRKTYDTMLSQAGDILKAGGSVILDAAFLKRSERLKALTMAQESGAEFYAVECKIEPELAQKRLLQRLAGVSVSDGRWDIYLKQQQWFEPVIELSDNHIIIDTSLPLGQNVKQILNRID